MNARITGAGVPGSNRYAAFQQAADFKSCCVYQFHHQGINRLSNDSPGNEVDPCESGREPESNRPTRICNPVHNRFVYRANVSAIHRQKREAWASLFGNLEREKSLELSTSTLARLRSTN
jgi:hypothetical protein